MGREPDPGGRGRSPSFCKVMFGDFSEQLLIPPAFAKNFDGVLPQEIVLRSPASRVRRVTLKKVEQQSFFEKGWSLFVKDNSLEFGDFLVFYDAGNSEFKVEIFGKNGCKKEVFLGPRRRRSNVKYIESSDETSDQSDIPTQRDPLEIQEYQPLQASIKRRERKKRSASQVVTDSPKFWGIPSSMLPPSAPMTILQRKAKALEAANAFVSEHPSFKVVMSPSHAYKLNMGVPMNFVKKYLASDLENLTLRISDRLWSVKLITYEKYGKVQLGAGWPQFAKDNRLQEGDVCVFELIERNDVVLEVHIFKCFERVGLSGKLTHDLESVEVVG